MTNTLRAIFPTEEHGLGFQYFHGNGPCDPGSPEQSWCQAWWCAQLSLLAYTRNPQLVSTCLAKGGLQGAVHEGGGAQYLLAHDGNGNAWVAFRGTEIVVPSDLSGTLPELLARFLVSVRDWGGNFDLPADPWPGPDGPARAHRGFKTAYESVRGQLKTELEPLARNSLRFTGHSLGGALATLAAADWKSPVKGVYTFGSPRVGDAAFVQAIGVRHGRVVNGSDGVPLVPPEEPLGYRHHAQAAHKPVESATALFATVGIRDEPAGLLGALTPTADALPAAFVHHAPLLYVAQCARNLDRPWG